MWSSFKIAIPILVLVAGMYLLFVVRTCACNTKDRAFMAAMKSDLRNVQYAQDAHRADGGRYAAALGPLGYRPSTGVTLSLVEVTDSGWSARATHDRVRGACGIWVGTVSRRPVAAPNDSLAGAPYCERLRLID